MSDIKHQPAFPRPYSEERRRGDHEDAQRGMSIRHYAAIAAMQGILANGAASEMYRVNDNWIMAKTIAEDAIKVADELCKQLEQ